jgi:glycosyltransferase involved in cell wall biosynthesis
MTPPSVNNDGFMTLRVAHCVGFYFPENVGGTEVYVRDLAIGLTRFSVESEVVAATDRGHETYSWADVPVFRYPNNWADIRAEAISAPRPGISKFQELILRARPDVFHLHSWTAGAGLKHLAQVAQLGIPRVVTVHVPSALCLRGTMLLNGKEPCDGRIEEQRCTQCWALSRGLPMPAAYAVSHLPRVAVTPDLSRTLGRVATVLSARSLVDAQIRDLAKMAELSDRIVAPSQWVFSALVANAVPPDKIFISRQAVADSFVQLGTGVQRTGDSTALRIGFVGRLEPYKGPHVLLAAMQLVPKDLPVKLIVAGSGTEPPYLRTLEAAAAGDDRIEFLGSISHGQLPDFLKRIDVLAVPSNYMETGPLVVLEAFAFGIPVMGANLGGIAERIRDGVDGWLLPFHDSQAWADAIAEIAVDRDKLARLTAGIAVNRTMTTVAGEMASIYREVAEAGRAEADKRAAGLRAG